jgi:hypothetical protein
MILSIVGVAVKDERPLVPRGQVETLLPHGEQHLRLLPGMVCGIPTAPWCFALVSATYLVGAQNPDLLLDCFLHFTTYNNGKQPGTSTQTQGPANLTKMPHKCGHRRHHTDDVRKSRLARPFCESADAGQNR